MMKNFRKIVIAIMMLAFSFIYAAGVFAGGLDHKYSLALRQNVLVFRQPPGADAFISDRSFGMTQSALRYDERIYFGNATVSAALDTKLGFTSSGMAGLGMFESGGGIFGTSDPVERWDATFDHIPDGSTTLQTRLQRLDVRWSIGSYDIDIGRQPLSLGTSHFIGVLDVIAPFSPGDLDATYKPGVDAVRFRRGIGMTGEAEVIAVASKPWDDGALIGRYRTSVKGVDLEVVGGRFRHRGFGGIGWEGGVGEVGIWGELALFEHREGHENIWGGLSGAAFSAVSGIDVNLPADFKAGGALMYQDFGVRDPEDLDEAYAGAPFREGWAFLASAGYGLVTLHRQMHPLIDADLAGILNLVDGSTLWQPRLTVSISDNADMSFYGWISTGRESEYTFTGIDWKSEFGAIPDGGGFYTRWFF